MIALPSTLEIAGKNLAIYESLYKEVDPPLRGAVNAPEAAGFLKRSNLGNVTLGQVWDIADHQKRGYLDKQGIFAALKLIALVQHGKEPVVSNLLLDVPPPNIARQADSPSLPMFGSQDVEWAIGHAEKTKYDDIYESLGPTNGKLSGDQVKPVLLNSGLPTEILGKIWDLSDIDKDGFLDRDEMTVCLHLVYRSLENDVVPLQLPLSMIPPSKRATAAATGGRRGTMAGAVPVLPPHPSSIRSRAGSTASIDNLSMSGGVLTNSPSLGASRSLTGTPTPSLSVKPPAPWIVEKLKYESVFISVDTDHDGLVSGGDVKGIFLQSGLSQVYLAHIWNLCDIKSSGMLNLEQFALAMHLIEHKKQFNLEPPAELPPDLLPPSFRPNPAGMTDMGTSTVHDSIVNNASPHISERQHSSGNKEIDRMTDEIHELQKNRRDIDSQLVQMDADITIKQSEIRNLEVELNTLEATVKQLERQRTEAQKRLDDLEMQKTSVQKTVEELRQKVEMEQMEIQHVRTEVDSSAVSAKNLEDELNRKRLELQQLRDEEGRTDVKLQMQKTALQHINRREQSAESGLEKAQQVIDQIREKRSILIDKLQKLEQALQTSDFTSLDSDASLLIAAVFDIDLSFLKTNVNHRHTTGNNFSNPWNADGTTENQFSYRQFGTTPPSQTAFTTAAAHVDPFQSSDPFAGHDPFHSPVSGPNPVVDDPFTSSLSTSDPFTTSARAPTGFDSDPFASYGGDTWSNPVDASAAGGKRPPPRPAPPKSRPITPGNVGARSDPFGSTADPWGESAPATTGAGSAGFADFANFDQFS